MKNLKTAYLLSFAFILSPLSYSQQRAVTTIQQNVNEAAHGLEQKLNFTLDTLTLRSTTDILRVTFLDHSAKDSHIIDVGSKEIKIPLYHFKKGRYTIAVYTHNKIIALGANRLNDIPKPEDAVVDLEESILRASLAEDELVARNIKPRKKKPSATREKNKRIVQVKPEREVKPKREVKVRPKKVKEIRVAEAKPKIKTNFKKPKRTVRRKPKSNGKSTLTLALQKRERKREEASAAKKEFIKIRSEKDITIRDKKDKSVGTLLSVKKVTYNLSKLNNDETTEKQSRADYRANNLRPNGTPYEN